MKKEKLLTPEEVAEYLKVPVQTIWRWCRNGDLPALKVGKYWRIPENEFGDFIQSKRNQAFPDLQDVKADNQIAKANGNG